MSRRPSADVSAFQVANKEDWNSLVMTAKMTNSVELTDVLRFIGTWAGTGQQGFRL